LRELAARTARSCRRRAPVRSRPRALAPARPPAAAPPPQPAEVESLEAEVAAARGKRRRGGKGAAAAAARPSELTLDQKLDAAVAEAESAKKDTAAMLADAARTFDMLRALLEQAELRASELKKEAHEFRRDVVLAGESARTGAVKAEAVVAFYEDELRRKDAHVDKLRLKAASLKAAEAKLTAALAAKEEVGDVLHYIDFHQLQIEHAQATAALEERNVELMRLKLTTGATVGSLNGLKSQLAGLSRTAARLKADIAARREQTARLREDNATLAAEIERARALNRTLIVQVREARDMPQTIDYVELTRTQAALAREISDWRRKVEIAVMADAHTTTRLRAAAASGALDGTIDAGTLRALGRSASAAPRGGGAAARGAARAGADGAGGAARGASARRPPPAGGGYSAAGVTASVTASLPGAGGVVTYGATTLVAGVTGTRPMGSATAVSGKAVRAAAVAARQPAVLPRTVGGHAGAVGGGTLSLGRPRSLIEVEQERARALAAKILGARHG